MQVISNEDTQSQNGVKMDSILTSITNPEDTKPEPPEVLDLPAASAAPSYIPRSTIPVLKRPVMARAPNTSDKTQGKAMETQFFNKKRKFTNLKKELEEKQ
ncbi:unnamed protein product, partial [Timema podura]|nr:unnamed protein product [Timema podura]